MAANNNDEAYAKLLTENLQRAIDWLKFAEAKNAALLGIASAWTLAGLNIVCSDKFIPELIHACILIALGLSGLAALTAMSAFLPKLKRPDAVTAPPSGATLNLLYYGDIAKLKASDLATEFRGKYDPAAQGPTSGYIADLVEQVRINSGIALSKMNRFNLGMWIMLGSVFFVVLSGFIYAGQELRAIW